MRAWMDVAVLAKTRNAKGRLVVKSTAGLPFLLEEGDEVAFVPPRTDVVRRAVVQAVYLADDRSADVEFEGVDGDTARALVGCHCLIRRSSIDETQLQDEPAFWNEWHVVDDEAGPIGEVADVIDNPGQMLLQVKRPDGLGEVLIPVVDEIVRDVDVASRIVGVTLPNGLLDL